MKTTIRKTIMITLAAATLAAAPIAMSHLDDKEMQQSYRQSFFALVAMNFGPMAAMIKGDMPYNAEQMQSFSDDLSTLMNLEVMRGFGEGSDKGTTRARPEIWQNTDDFSKKMDDLRTAVSALNEAVATGDKKAIGQQIGATGGSCKGCHDDYKSKDYLY